MTRSLLVLASCALPLAAAAESKKSVTHSMHWTEGDTVHIADGGGAINRHGDVRIDVEIFSSKKVVVTDAGTRREHNLYESYSSDEEWVWTNVWKGTWKASGSKMTLNLRLHDHKCTYTKSWSDAAPETKPCDPVGKKLAMTCELGKVAVESTRVAAWTCSPSGDPELGETPRHWVLGKGSCVQVSSTRYGLREGRHQNCAKP